MPMCYCEPLPHASGLRMRRRRNNEPAAFRQAASGRCLFRRAASSSPLPRGKRAVTGIDANENSPTTRNAGQKSDQTIVALPLEDCVRSAARCPQSSRRVRAKVAGSHSRRSSRRPTSRLGISAYASELSDVNCSDGKMPPHQHDTPDQPMRRAWKEQAIDRDGETRKRRVEHQHRAKDRSARVTARRDGLHEDRAERRRASDRARLERRHAEPFLQRERQQKRRRAEPDAKERSARGRSRENWGCARAADRAPATRRGSHTAS